MITSPPYYIFDACALIALLQVEPGAEVPAALLAGLQATCLIQVVNVCEVLKSKVFWAADNSTEGKLLFASDATLLGESVSHEQ